VDRRAVRLVHLVKLVNAAHTVVSEDKGTALEDHLAGDGVAHDRRRQTHARRTLARCVDAAGGDLGNVLEQLRLGHTGVAHEADIEVT